LLILLFVVQSTLHAASQGKLGNVSSRGTVGITLVIPEFTRLVADLETRSSPEDSRVCMHVINSTEQSRENYYRVAGLAGSDPSNDETGLIELDKITQLVKLDNYYQAKSSIKSLCDYQDTYVKQLQDKDNQTLLFVLITE
jgi:hypothetical protein